MLNEDCASQCKSSSTDEQIQASCQVGCTLSGPVDEVVPEKPVIAVDPVPVRSTCWSKRNSNFILGEQKSKHFSS